MSVRTKCNRCGKTLKAPDQLAGKRGRCPGCQQVVRFPANCAELVESTVTTEAYVGLHHDEFATNNHSYNGYEASTYADCQYSYPPPQNFESLWNAQPWGYGNDNVVANPPSVLRLWVLILAFAPLAWTILFPAPPEFERIARVFEENPELRSQFESAKSPDELFAVFPNERFPGAHLSRDSGIHWFYALASSVCFLLVAKALLPGSNITPLRLGSFGLFTATIGILLMFAIQQVAVSTDAIVMPGLGAVAFLTSIVKFFAFSYRCALDSDTGFTLSFIGFTCGAGLFEEVCKSLPIVLYLTSRRQTDWRTTALVGFASGIGFGVSEGVTYCSEFYNGVAPAMIYLVRFVSCVMLHAIWTSAVGLLMYANQRHLPGNSDSKGYARGMMAFVVYYISVAMTLHGLYDTLLKKDMEPAALVVAAISFAWWVWLVNRQIASEREYQSAYAFA